LKFALKTSNVQHFPNCAPAVNGILGYLPTVNWNTYYTDIDRLTAPKRPINWLTAVLDVNDVIALCMCMEQGARL